MRIETREKIENLLRHTTLLCVSFIDHHKLTINVYIHEYIYILSEQHVATTMMCKKVKEKNINREGNVGLPRAIKLFK